MTKKGKSGLTDEEIKRHEERLIRELLPEFDQVPVTTLATILELTSIQWITYQVVKKKSQADQINDLLFSVVYRQVETLSELEKKLMQERLMDENYLSPILQKWLSQKAYFLEQAGE